jgi:CP family cyanate transporter-like MFS transporter
VTDTATGERGVPLARAFAALVLVGLSLRTQVLVIGPLVGEIKADLGMSHAVAGLLGSIPVLCMAILAPVGPVLGGAIGPRLGAALCVAFVGGFGLVRSVAPDATIALLSTIGVGVGMAIVGPILAMVVRQRAPNHPAAGTGAYVVGMVVGATLTAAAALPLSATVGGWRGAFAAISAAGLVSIGAWLWLMPRDATTGAASPKRVRLPWRRPSAWLLGVIFGTQSIIFYGSITWLASLYVERGWRATDAAGLVALITGMGLFATLAVPLFADRVGTRRGQLATAGLIAIVGLVVIALTPAQPSGSPVTLIGTALVGFGIGLYFPLVLTLPVDIAANPEEAASISALMLLVGYVIASTAPVVLGLVRDATGGFEGIVAIFVVVAISMVVLGLALSPGRLERAAGPRPIPPPGAP